MELKFLRFMFLACAISLVSLATVMATVQPATSTPCPNGKCS